jgi:hypothetical protein
MVEYEFDPDRKLLVVRVTGVVTDGDFGDDAFPDVPEGTLELLDLSGTTEARISNTELRRVSDVDRKRPDRVERMAILATRDVAFGLARMYQMLTEGMRTEVAVFRDHDEAMAWLGLADAPGPGEPGSDR